MPLSPGQTLNNRYRIAQLLSQGGFGAVYRAWDLNLEKITAVKENLETSDAGTAQFQREAKFLSNLSHPNLPRVTDYFVIPGQGQYLVMDFIEGKDLQTMLRENGGPLPEALALDWAFQVCDALNYLHAQTPPIIHRDIKPANIRIMTSAQHPQGRAVLVDFGIAKQQEAGKVTTMGARAVTHGFSPPEQYGLGITDAQSDVYALGATLYHLLTGLDLPAAMDLVSGQAAALRPAQQINPAISPHTSQALEHAMQLNMARRTPSIAALKAELSALPAGGVPVQPPPRPATVTPTEILAPPLYEMGRTPAKASFPWLLLVAGAGVGLVLLLLVGFFVARVLLPQKTPTPLAILPVIVESAAPSIPPTEAAPSTPAPGAMPAGQPGETRLSEVDGMAMVFIPPGQFMMGSSLMEMGSKEDQTPRRTVTLDGYWMDRSEVTNAMYARCVAAGACSPPARLSSARRESYYGNSDFDSYPVIWVTWYDAQAYCSWAGRRLPTEAEWERAARSDQGAAYPWGDDLPYGNSANYCDVNCTLDSRDPSVDDGYADTSLVGSFPRGASPYQIYDMAGNVWEWAADWYATAYDPNALLNPTGPVAGDFRILRGGSFEGTAYDIRAANRYASAPDVASVSFGFRCAVSALREGSTLPHILFSLLGDQYETH
ncbi:MAG: SUMF1/EgtB/PvdO family nonheme iron enzyme [Anaerolineales bacterium]|nr:SUMF1/EgtB/PvdO family nonheme iron enzyme [Anaerolineales bacterium]